MEPDRKGPKRDKNDPPPSSTRGNVRRRIPLKMFGKKLMSKRLLVSSKVWMRTIPTRDCDVVLTLPANTQDTTLMWLLSRLRSRTPRLLVNFKHHSNSGIYALYLTANYESLLEGAEELGIRKPLRQEYGGGMKEFVMEDQECFEGVGEEERFLTSQERQSIVHHMLNNLRAVEGEELEKVKFIEGQPIVPRLLSKNIVSAVFPLHCQQDLAVLRKTWVQAVFSRQPLDDVCRYFGAKIGLYFVFLGHYATWLVAPALLGVAMWFLQSVNQFWEDVSWVVFSVFNVFWATLYLLHWKRTTATYAYRWGTLDKKDELLKDPRPLYKGDLQKSPITGRMEPHYSAWKRNLFRYFVSTPVIVSFLCLVFTTMLLIFELQEWVNVLVAKEDIHPYFCFGPKVLLAIVISIFDELYKKVAVWLNQKENYRLEETHETNLVIKLVLFQFVNSFLSLFYIAFYLRDMDRLRDQLAALLITRQVVGNVKEVLLPLILWKLRLYSVGYRMASEMSENSLEKESEKLSKVYRNKLEQSLPSSSSQARRRVKESKDKAKAEQESDGGRDTVESCGSLTDEHTLTQVEVESAMSEYDDAFEDYLEMCMQFGYVTLFSSAFPLAALFALLNNVIEIRSDAFKLCYTFRRPFGIRAEDSGIWQGVIHVMALIAVVVNSALIGMGDLVHRLAPTLSMTSNILLIVIFEHIILCIRAGVEYSVPEVPHWIATEMAKVEFQRREALKRLEAQGSSHGSDVRDRTRTKTPDIPDATVTSSRSITGAPSPANHQSLVGHRPQNFSSNHNSAAGRSSESLASGHSAGEGDQSKRTSPCNVDGDTGMYRNPWQLETQIYRRNVASTPVGRSIVKRAQFGRSRSLEFVSSFPVSSPSAVSPGCSPSPSRETISPSRETVLPAREASSPSPSRESSLPARETSFLASGETVTYVKGSSGHAVDGMGNGSSVPSQGHSATSVLDSSVDIPSAGDETVDP